RKLENTLKSGKKPLKIAVLGGGLWGTVLAHHLARKGQPVWLWEFFQDLARNLQDSRKHPHIPDFELAASVRVTSDLADAVEQANVIVSALPSPFVRGTFRQLRNLLG